jgi:hypothetical protein
MSILCCALDILRYYLLIDGAHGAGRDGAAEKIGGRNMSHPVIRIIRSDIDGSAAHPGEYVIHVAEDGVVSVCDHAGVDVGTESILSDRACERLASFGPVRASVSVSREREDSDATVDAIDLL